MLSGTRYSNDSFQLHALVNTVAMSSAKTLRCLSDMSHVIGTATIGPDSGAPHNEVRFISEERSELMASVAALETLLGSVGIEGFNCLTSDGTRPGVRAFMQNHNPCGVNGRASGSNHQRVTVAKSHLVITGLGGQRGQTCYANVRVIELSEDGDALADEIVYNAALPGTVIADEEFVIAVPTIAGLELDDEHVLGWNINTGIGVTAIVPAGKLRPTVVDITKTAPVITVTHDDASLCDDAKIPREGVQCALADTFFPFRKRNPWGGLYDVGEAQHLKIAAAGFAYHSRRYEASGSGVGTGEITIECTEGVGAVSLSVTANTTLESSS